MASSKQVRAIARTVTVLWASFWCFFVIATVLTEAMHSVTGVLIVMVVITVLCSSTALLFVNERAGATAMTLGGMTLCIVNSYLLNNPTGTQTFLLFTLCFPPVLAGLILLWPLRRTGAAN